MGNEADCVGHGSSDAKLTVQSATHVGWIPTVSGRLLFQWVSCGLRKTHDISLVHTAVTGNALYTDVFLHSDVDWEDQPLEGFTGRFSAALATSFEYSASQIRGVVYLLPSYREEAKTLLKDSRELQSKYLAKLKSQGRKKTGRIEPQISAIQRYLDGLSTDRLFKVHFFIKQNGLVFLRLDVSKHTHFDDHAHTIVRQAYYYIKFAWHKHKHHANDAESLTSVHNLVNGEVDGRLLLNELIESLVQIKRNLRPYRLRQAQQALGIISYARSLALTLRDEQFMDDGSYSLQTSYLDNFADSFRVALSSSQRNMEILRDGAATYRSIVLFVVAFATPLALMSKLRIPADHGPVHWLHKIANFVTESSIGFSFSVFVLVGSYFGFTRLRTKYGEWFLSVPWLKDVFRNQWVGRMLKRKAALPILYGTLATLMAIFLYSLDIVWGG